TVDSRHELRKPPAQDGRPSTAGVCKRPSPDGRTRASGDRAECLLKSAIEGRAECCCGMLGPGALGYCGGLVVVRSSAGSSCDELTWRHRGIGGVADLGKDCMTFGDWMASLGVTEPDGGKSRFLVRRGSRLAEHQGIVAVSAVVPTR